MKEHKKNQGEELIDIDEKGDTIKDQNRKKST